LERKYESKLATQAEFGLIQLQSARRTKGKVAARQAATKERTNVVLDDIGNALQRVKSLRNPDFHTAGGASESSAAKRFGTQAEAVLADVAERYKQQVNRMFPSWQLEMEQEAFRRLRKLERTEGELRKRQAAAKSAFEKEKTIRAMVADKEHDVEVLRMQEHAEQALRDRERAKLEHEARARAIARYREQQENLVQNVVSPVHTRVPHDGDAAVVDLPSSRGRDYRQGAEEKSGRAARAKSAQTPYPQTPISRPHTSQTTSSVPDLLTPLPASAARHRPKGQTSGKLFHAVLEDKLVDDSSSDEGFGKQNLPTQVPSPKSSQKTSPSQRLTAQASTDPYVSPTRNDVPFVQTPQRNNETGALDKAAVSTPRSPAFILTYDWQSVPLGKTLPPQAEQRFNTTKGMGRMARIPNSWNLQVQLNETGRRFEVRVEQNDEIGLVAREVSTLAFGDNYPLVITCDDRNLSNEDTVGSLGAELFTGDVRARKLPFTEQKSAREVKRAVPRTVPPTKKKENFMQGQQRWDVVATDLEILFESLRNPNALGELRASKHGLLESEEEIPSSNVTRLKQDLRSRGRQALRESTNIDLILQAIFSLLSVEAGGLLSLSLLGDGSMTTDLSRVAEALHRFHASCRDGRERVWRLLVDYWQWVLRERLVSREDLASIFMPVLLPPGERPDGICAANIRWLVREFASNPQTLNQISPSMRNTQRQLTFDELLDSSPHTSKHSTHPDPPSSSSRSELIDDDEAENDDEFDASRLVVQNNIGESRLGKPLHSFDIGDIDDDIDDDEELADVSDGGEESASLPKAEQNSLRYSTSALDHFIAANKPTYAGILEERDVVDEDDDEFDF